MPRRSKQSDLTSLIAGLVRRDPRWLIVVLLVALFLLLLDQLASPPDLGPAPEPPTEGYLFCSWNDENLLDDTDDPKNSDPLDSWFASDPEALRRKNELLADTLIALDGGRGPDILALIEVENRRAVEILVDALKCSAADRLAVHPDRPRRQHLRAEDRARLDHPNPLRPASDDHRRQPSHDPGPVGHR
jgi:hypothetical protein